MADSTAGLFAHAAYPLEHSLSYPGDPGLFGPDSASWEVLGDVASFIGGIRALLIQAAHPEVVAGVSDHSSYEADPLGRLSRTSAYVTATGYGAMPEVEQALALVRRAHVPVKGTSHRGQRYSANGSAFASWVHNVLIDSFLTTHQTFGPTALPKARANSFVDEQAQLGAMLSARDLPRTQDSLADWIASHPDLAPSPGMEATVRFLKNPPLPLGIRQGYRVLFQAAAATVPPRIADMLGVREYPGAVAGGKAMVTTLRWSMGSSPSWWLALERVGAPFPDGVRFRRPPAAVGAAERFEASATPPDDVPQSMHETLKTGTDGVPVSVRR
ncbi:MAG: oxygenase MpaB family protein [Acidimicrobiia bacterium]|nr:oxygenase MpaB family protein [Acidimicrobiia bacterium]